MSRGTSLDRDHCDVRLDRLHQILDAGERARDRARTGAARALVVHAERVALEARCVVGVQREVGGAAAIGQGRERGNRELQCGNVA